MRALLAPALVVFRMSQGRQRYVPIQFLRSYGDTQTPSASDLVTNLDIVLLSMDIGPFFFDVAAIITWDPKMSDGAPLLGGYFVVGGSLTGLWKGIAEIVHTSRLQ